MKNKYDIIVVGAGPAGSTAAKFAAENGADVLILDRRNELGVPVQCGEALSEEALIDLDIDPDPRWAVNKVDRMKLVSPSGKSVDIEQKTSTKVGYILDRKVFDEELAIRAVRAGADIQIGTFVNGLVQEDGEIRGVSFSSRDKDGEVNSDLIIAADGVMSRTARWAGIDTTLGPEEIESGAQFKMVDIDIEFPHSMEFYFGSDMAPGGYTWIFPKDQDIANVGIGVLPAFAEKPPVEYLKDFISTKPGLKDGRIVEMNVGGVPVSGPIEKTVSDSIMVVGDAARFVNPMTGGGINFAMKSGKIAGEVGAKAISEGDTSESYLSEYEDGWKDEIGDKLEKYEKGKDILLELSDEELDDVAETFQDMDFEEISLTKLFGALIESNPKLMWKLKSLI